MSEEQKNEGNIYQRMAAIIKDVDAIGKNSKNKSQGFNYRGIDDVYNSLHRIMAAHGVFMTSEIISKERTERPSNHGGTLAFTCLRMRYRFNAADGSSVATETEGEGMDSGDKSSNKAMSIAQKYALMQAFCIPTADLADPDAESPKIGGAPAAPKKSPPPATITDEQADALQKPVNAAYADPNERAAFMKWLCDGWRIQNISELQASRFEETVKIINDELVRRRNTREPGQEG